MTIEDERAEDTLAALSGLIERALQ